MDLKVNLGSQHATIEFQSGVRAKDVNRFVAHLDYWPSHASDLFLMLVD